MSITYRKFSFKISPFKIGSEILVAQLEFLGFDGFEETDEGIDAFIINDKFQKHILNKLQILSNPDFEISYSSKNLVDFESFSLPILIGMIFKFFKLLFICSLSREGISSLQGRHQVAQKLIITSLFLKSDNLI